MTDSRGRSAFGSENFKLDDVLLGLYVVLDFKRKPDKIIL